MLAYHHVGCLDARGILEGLGFRGLGFKAFPLGSLKELL